ncbi:MAG: response regulator transcription factor [Planctomycetota bacterium]
MRLLVIEDSARLRTSLQKGLTREGFSVDVAENGEAGLTLALHNPFDLLILDLMLPGIGGLEVLRAVRKSKPDQPVLILTAKDTTAEVVEGLAGGADDYMVKPFAFEELLARCHALIRRRYRKGSGIMELGPLRFDQNARRAFRDGEDLGLTARDLLVFEYLAMRSGEVVTREELEDHIYRTSALPNSNAIDSAVCALRRKIDGDGPSLIRTIRGVGYMLEAKSA